jgi:hypothetical protein
MLARRLCKGAKVELYQGDLEQEQNYKDYKLSANTYLW